MKSAGKVTNKLLEPLEPQEACSSFEWDEKKESELRSILLAYS